MYVYTKNRLQTFQYFQKEGILNFPSIEIIQQRKIRNQYNTVRRCLLKFSLVHAGRYYDMYICVCEKSRLVTCEYFRRGISVERRPRMQVTRIVSITAAGQSK